MIKFEENETISELIQDPKKIMIIEGPDGSGKSTLIKYMESELGKVYNVVVLRFPDDRGDVSIRSTLFNSDIAKYKDAAPYLFMADFAHAIEQYIVPKLNDANTLFIFDRFIPSLCVYQSIDLQRFNTMFYTNSLRTLQACYPDIVTIYLTPSSLDAHRARLFTKSCIDNNSYDPTTDAEIINQVNLYSAFIQQHEVRGIFGSHDVREIFVDDEGDIDVSVQSIENALRKSISVGSMAHAKAAEEIYRELMRMRVSK